MAKDYYTLLGVEKSANDDDIKKAFRKLAHKYHPDKKDGDEARFKEISEAYSVLSDQKRRAEYDSYGQVFNEGGGGQGQGFGGFGGGFNAQGFEGVDINDIFGDIFGGGGGSRSPKRGRDISIDIEIPFRDSVFGVERKVLLTKTSQCDTCTGSGAKKGTEFGTCSACNGNGNIREVKRSILGSFNSVRECDTCHGKGEVPKEKCAACKGLGINRGENEIKIAIPSNIDNGEMIRMTGAGEAVTGGNSGDLYIKIHVKPHADFVKEGTSLKTTLNVKLTDALLGSEYSLETLDGTIKVKVPSGTRPNDTLRVKGKGVPLSAGSTSKRGDLYIKLNVELPKKLSRKAKKLVEELKNEGI